MKNTSYKLVLGLAAAAVLILIGASVIYTINSSKGSKPSAKPAQTQAGPSTPAPTLAITSREDTLISRDGIVLSVDTEAKTISVQSIDSDSPLTQAYTYTGLTNIRTSYDKVIAAALLSPGDFVTVTYNSSLELASVIGIDKVKAYKGILNMAIDDDYRRILISDTIYRYNDNLIIMQNGDFISMDKLTSYDVFDVYSIDNYIYRIDVTTGHGYLTLTGAEDFIGGSLYIDGNFNTQIGEDTRLILTEGMHTLYAQNFELEATASIRIKPYDTLIYDLAPYGRKPVETGRVVFQLDPEGALLFIDGQPVFYADPVNLTYGSHSLEAELGGYMSFKGHINVDRDKMIFSINLPPMPAPAEADDRLYPPDEPTAGPQPEDSGSSSLDPQPEDSGSTSPDPSQTETTEEPAAPTARPTASPTAPPLDDDDRSAASVPSLIIRGTDGSALFINDIYKGLLTGGSIELAPCPTGTLNIRFTKEGYNTANYTIEIPEADQDYIYSFPEMVAR